MACELQKLMCAVMIIRQQHIGRNLDSESLRLCLKLHLGNDAPNVNAALHESLMIISPMALLQDCNYISRQIALAEDAFIGAHLPPTSMTKTAAVRGEEHLSCRPDVLKLPPSPTELHRIRRALWRSDRKAVPREIRNKTGVDR